MSHELVEAMAGMKEQEALGLAKKMLDDGEDPKQKPKSPEELATLDELFEALTLVQTHKVDPLPVILFGEKYWKGLIDFDFLVKEGTIGEFAGESFWTNSRWFAGSAHVVSISKVPGVPVTSTVRTSEPVASDPGSR